MTNKEAIQFLDNMRGQESGRAIGKDGFYAELCGYHVQALNVAIKALNEQKTGHWEWTDGDERIMKASFYTKWTCTSCGCKRPERTKYCPNCGAKMEEQA